MVWWPFSLFTRQAQNTLQNANTNALKSALRNYIKAVNNLPNKNNAHIYGLMMKTANGANASYKNRMVNGIAKIVAASRRGIAQAAVAVANGAPEGNAAAAVNNATRKINNFKVSPPIPAPVGLAGKVFGVTKGKNQNNNASRTNINYITKIAKNKTGYYKGNSNRVQAVLAYNPTLNYTALMNKTNNANVKRLLKLLANVPAAAKPAAAAPAVNTVNNTGAALATMFGEEKMVKAPNGRNIAVVRTNSSSRWTFKNNANKAKYNLNNRNKNTPTIRNVNVSTGSMFNTAATHTGTPNTKKGQVAGVERNVYYHKNNRNGYFIKNTNGYYKKLSNGNANTGTWPAPTNNRKYEYNRNDGFEAIGTSTN